MVVPYGVVVDMYGVVVVVTCLKHALIETRIFIGSLVSSTLLNTIMTSTASGCPGNFTVFDGLTP